MSPHFAVHRRTVAAALFVVLLAGCSGIKTYPNDLEKNLHVRTDTRSGSMFEKVRAAVDIYRVDPQCRLDYQGTVKLDKPALDVGLPAGRLGYLVFNFASSSFLGGSKSSISQETLLKPLAGSRYDVDVSYRDDIYNVVVRENSSRKGAGREIALVGLEACKKF